MVLNFLHRLLRELSALKRKAWTDCEEGRWVPRREEKAGRSLLLSEYVLRCIAKFYVLLAVTRFII